MQALPEITERIPISFVYSSLESKLKCEANWLANGRAERQLAQSLNIEQNPPPRRAVAALECATWEHHVSDSLSFGWSIQGAVI